MAAQRECNDLGQLAEKARILREGNLLRSDDEHRAVLKVEVDYARCRADASNAWEEVFKIWDDLFQIYPSNGEIEDERRNALIELICAEADQKAFHDPEGAIQYLIQMQQGDGKDARALNASWKVWLKVAKLHANNGTFTEAWRYSRQAGIRAAADSEAAQKEVDDFKSWLTSKEIAEEAKRQCSTASEPVEKLRYLKEALENPRLNHEKVREDLRKTRDEIFWDARQEVLREAEAEVDPNRAIYYYVLLLEMAELADDTTAKGEALTHIQGLGGNVPNIINALLRDAGRFITTTARDFPLEEALRQAAKLKGRIAALLRVCRALELQPSQELQERHERIAEIYTDLLRLADLLKKTEETELWERAVLGNNFDHLRELLRQMQLLHAIVASRQEVQEFERRLEEWEEVSSLLDKGIQDIRGYFVDDWFEAVTETVDKLATLPSRRQYVTLDQETYAAIFTLVGTRARVVDTNNVEGDGLREIVGWGEIRREAEERIPERNAWRRWREELERLYEKAERCYNDAKSFDEEFFYPYLQRASAYLDKLLLRTHATRLFLQDLRDLIRDDLELAGINQAVYASPDHTSSEEDFQPQENLSHSKRCEVWSRAKDAIQRLKEHLSGGPKNKNGKLPVRCKAAQEAQECAQETHERINSGAVNHVERVVEQIKNVKGQFPKRDDFQMVENEINLLGAMLTRAEIVGASDETERILLNVYRALYASRGKQSREGRSSNPFDSIVQALRALLQRRSLM